VDIKICTADIARCTPDNVVCSGVIVTAQQTSVTAQETSKNSGKNCIKAVDMLCIHCGWIGISDLTDCFFSIILNATIFWLNNDQSVIFSTLPSPAKTAFCTD
jgi:hypothetical protein